MSKSGEKMRLCNGTSSVVRDFAEVGNLRRGWRSDPDSVLGTSGECEAEQINSKVALFRRRPTRIERTNSWFSWLRQTRV